MNSAQNIKEETLILVKLFSYIEGYLIIGIFLGLAEYAVNLLKPIESMGKEKGLIRKISDSLLGFYIEICLQLKHLACKTGCPMAAISRFLLLVR